MRKKRVSHSSLILKWGSIAACVFALFAVFGDQGLLKIHQGQRTEKRLEEMISNIRIENNHLTDEIKNLQDSKYLEKIIREELGMLRPDEVVYYIEKK